MQMIIAKYTEVLKNLIDEPHTKDLIDNAMSSYPLYESTSERKYGQPNIIPTREELNNAILDYYKYREIGFETVGRFIDELRISLNEIMPFYNQLYYSADQDYNMIYNVDYIKTISREKDNTIDTTSSGTTNSSDTTNTSMDTDVTATSTTNETLNNKNVSSDTPQGLLTIPTNSINSVQYANNVTFDQDINAMGNDSSSSTESEGTNTSTGETTSENTANTQGNEQEEITESTKGNYGVVSAQDLIAKYREQVRNITQEIINDPRISELFMLVY